MNTLFNKMYFTHMELEMPTYTDFRFKKKVVVEEVSLIVEWKYGNKYQNVRSISTTHSQYLKDTLKYVC